MRGNAFSPFEQSGSRDDRAIIGTCSLLTSTDRFKENYSIDIVISIHYWCDCRNYMFQYDLEKGQIFVS